MAHGKKSRGPQEDDRGGKNALAYATKGRPCSGPELNEKYWTSTAKNGGVILAFHLQMAGPRPLWPRSPGRCGGTVRGRYFKNGLSALIAKKAFGPVNDHDPPPARSHCIYNIRQSRSNGLLVSPKMFVEWFHALRLALASGANRVNTTPESYVGFFH
ncbi:predicted protein [Chaetomium globosum CBS 148.51]|uniref:Uncharacterized protein n=1 Tax=Chaetomium globosum (strain ATCC 6205 / CBS 148.51 / DSM 1962 / NBRC 6347 / NRRL 1970) TaxID=306901 RepID=Q2HHE4_CHAGB|nr:uncharacterized protein CHGG_00360 [Chaetomium globosum CBS 148.51]EAQ92125.1 predicted protein [Chaetomium globosum CBS 148.51]